MCIFFWNKIRLNINLSIINNLFFHLYPNNYSLFEPLLILQFFCQSAIEWRPLMPTMNWVHCTLHDLWMLSLFNDFGVQIGAYKKKMIIQQHPSLTNLSSLILYLFLPLYNSYSIPDFRVSTAIVLSRKNFLQVVQVGLWILARKQRTVR